MSISKDRKSNTVRIILDSNAFFIPLKFKVDIFEELMKLLDRKIECILLSPVKREMELLAISEKTNLQREAKYALQIAQNCKIIPVKEMGETTDDIIVRVAKKWNIPVFTNDRQLRLRLRDISVPVIYLRQKSRLDIDGLIS